MTEPSSRGIWRSTASGFCASLVGLGLARFAYTPLLPALVSAGWFDTGAAAYLGAANLAGYLCGALLGGVGPRYVAARWLLRGAMVLVTVSLLACAWPLGFAWFFAWRLLSGIAGSITMVLAAPTILPHIPRRRHGLVGGAIFVGVGAGITLSGTLVPLLLEKGLTQTWLGLALLSAIATTVGWGGWPSAPALQHSIPRNRPHDWPIWPLRVVYAIYALNAFAFVAHMIFLVAFVARGLGQGLDAGTHYWVLYGLGSIAGPVLTGRLADRIGFRDTVSLIIVVEILATGVLVLNTSDGVLAASSLAAGACTIGLVPVTLGRTRELLQHDPSAQMGAWRTATVSFAILQATGAYLMSFLLQRTGDYQLLYALAAGTLLVALLLDRTTGRARAAVVLDPETPLTDGSGAPPTAPARPRWRPTIANVNH